MGFTKVVQRRIAGYTECNATHRRVLGDYTGATAAPLDATIGANPLRGTLLWDRCMYILQGVSVSGGAVGGSYTITIQTDALVGYTGLPIASATIGPNTRADSGVVMDNLHQSAASPLPTHINVSQGSTGLVTFQVHAIAKQYRGTLGTQGSRTAERVIQGTMIQGVSGVGLHNGFADGKGFDASTTFTIGTTGSDMGLARMRLWDTALFWAIAGVSVDGAGDMEVIADVGGVTTSIASTGTGNALSAAGEKLALANNFYGQCPNPSQIIWTEGSAGDGISDCRVVVLAQSGRGSLAKS